MSTRPARAEGDRASHQLRQRKTRDRALVLVLAGTALLMPPIASIANFDGHIGGVPAVLIYVFAVWGLLIAGAFALSGRLQDGDGPPGYEGEGDG